MTLTTIKNGLFIALISSCSAIAMPALLASSILHSDPLPTAFQPNGQPLTSEPNTAQYQTVNWQEAFPLSQYQQL